MTGDTVQKTQPALVASWPARIAIGLAGVGLVVGYFMPWIRFGEVVALSGLSLSFTGGQAAEELSGPSSGLLLVVPLSGIGFVASAVRGYRAITWVGLFGGFAIFGVGLFTLIRVFLDSTGSGMWVVALSAILATAVGLGATRRH